MKGWKIGGIISFGLVSLIYGGILYSASMSQNMDTVKLLLKTYPIILLIFVPIGIVLSLIVSALKFVFKKEKKTRRKKGQIWVSTVLYIALGLVAMTVILSAGLPMINRMKERNTVIESKSMMHAISDAVSTVVSEGPGSKRVLDPVIIKGGKLIFDVAPVNKIRWEMKTSTMLMESCEDNDKDDMCDNERAIQREGDIEMYLLETIVIDEYMINLLLDYSLKGIDIVYTTENKVTGPLTGNYFISISNDRTTDTGDVTVGIYIG